MLDGAVHWRKVHHRNRQHILHFLCDELLCCICCHCVLSYRVVFEAELYRRVHADACSIRIWHCEGMRSIPLRFRRRNCQQESWLLEWMCSSSTSSTSRTLQAIAFSSSTTTVCSSWWHGGASVVSECLLCGSCGWCFTLDCEGYWSILGHLHHRSPRNRTIHDIGLSLNRRIYWGKRRGMNRFMILAPLLDVWLLKRKFNVVFKRWTASMEVVIWAVIYWIQRSLLKQTFIRMEQWSSLLFRVPLTFIILRIICLRGRRFRSMPISMSFSLLLMTQLVEVAWFWLISCSWNSCYEREIK